MPVEVIEIYYPIKYCAKCRRRLRCRATTRTVQYVECPSCGFRTKAKSIPKHISENKKGATENT